MTAPVWFALMPMTLAAMAAVIGRGGRLFFGAGAIGIFALLALVGDFYGAGAIYPLGGVAAPLGIALRLDDLSLAMLLVNAIVFALAGAYAAFASAQQEQNRRLWPLMLFLWGSLNALYLSNDLFNLYVTLELITLSAVALVALAGSKRALTAALHYLFAAWGASLFYLLGVGLIFAAAGTLDLTLLTLSADRPALIIGLVFILGALGLKTALFPLHFWLPTAHAVALTPVSALLSAAAIKGSFYLIARLAQTFEFPQVIVTLMGAAGALALLYGGLKAWRAVETKMVIAYSTVSQVGYFFLIFPLWSTMALQGGFLLLFSHALAKATLFLAAGTLIAAGGGPMLHDLKGTLYAAPLTVFGAFLSAISLAGLPPAGGFAGKWLLLQSALIGGKWFYVAVLILGSLLAMGYLARLLTHTLGAAAGPLPKAPKTLEAIVFLGGLLSVLLGLFASRAIGWLDSGSHVLSPLILAAQP